MLNPRSLTAVSGNANDEPVLTPNHFLIGQMGGELTPDTIDGSQCAYTMETSTGADL